jgi:hypothetical protein
MRLDETRYSNSQILILTFTGCAPSFGQVFSHSTAWKSYGEIVPHVGSPILQLDEPNGL